MKNQCSKGKAKLSKNVRLLLEEIAAKGFIARVVPMREMTNAASLLGGGRYGNPTDIFIRLNGVHCWYSFVMSDDAIIHMPVREMDPAERSKIAECIETAVCVVVIDNNDGFPPPSEDEPFSGEQEETHFS